MIFYRRSGRLTLELFIDFSTWLIGVYLPLSRHFRKAGVRIGPFGIIIYRF